MKNQMRNGSCRRRTVLQSSIFNLRSSILCSLLLAAGMLVGTAPQAEAGVAASGGTVSGYVQNGTNYLVHTFTTVGTNSFNVSAGGNVEVLVVGGGGGGGKGEPNGGGDGAGGGGAGGFVYSNSVAVVAGSNYTVTVGASGSGATTNTSRGNNGSNSVFGAIIADGGGGGGSDNGDVTGINKGVDGGSGGGAASLATGVPATETNTLGGAGTTGQGNAGGGSDAGMTKRGGGGGGGASAAGTTATSNTGAVGGNGTANSISGSSVTYAGGGGGGGCAWPDTAGGGAGGSGGGGAGGTGNSSTAYHGTNATANTGGGGGGGGGGVVGSSGNGGNGGSGIVIVRYVAMPTPSQMKIAFGGYTNRSEVLTNFPVLVVFSNNINNSGFHYGYFATTNGTDLRFGTDATPPTIGLNYEIESWNPNGASYVWVQAPTIPGNGSGAIWANWGNTAASSQLACTTNGAAWTNGFSSVWHFGRTNGVPDLRDSTSYRRNGTNVGSASATGRTGMGVDMESSVSNYVDVPTGLGSTYIPASNSTITLSCWFNPESIGAGELGNRLVNLHDNASGPSSALLLSLGQGNKLQALIDGGTSGGSSLVLTNSTSLSNGQWYHGALTYDGSVGILYQDGDEGRRTAAGATLNAGAAYPAKIGTVSTILFYDGLLDEVRISSVARSTNWVWAEYQTMAANTTFNNYGPMESQPFPQGTLILLR